MKVFPGICNKESQNVITFKDLQQILEKHALKKKHFTLYRGEGGLVPFILQKAVISLRAITWKVFVETCLSPSKKCIYVARVLRWKWRTALLLSKRKLCLWFLVQKSHLCFGVQRYTPIHLFSAFELNRVMSMHISPSRNNALLMHNWSVWLYANPKQHFQWTSNWETFFIQELCLPLCWSIVGVCFRVYSKEEDQEGPFPRHRASCSAGRLTNTRRAVPSSQHRNCLLTRWENHPSRGQNNL